MVGFWISFWLLLAFFPFAVFFTLAWYIKHSNKEISKKQKVLLGKKAIYLVIFYWLCDLFYMSIFTDNYVLIYVFGGLVALLIFSNWAKAFSAPKPKTGIEIFGLVQDFVVGTGVIIYLLYRIKDGDLQNVMIPVVAAVYGGLLTLLGVAWTIRWTNAENRNAHLYAIKPFFYFKRDYTRKDDKNNHVKTFNDKDDEELTENEKYRHFVSLGEYHNSSKIEFILVNVTIDGKVYPCSFGPAVTINESFELRFCYYSFDEFNYEFLLPNSFVLTVRDVDGNEYIYQIELIRDSLTNTPQSADIKEL